MVDGDIAGLFMLFMSKLIFIGDENVRFNISP
jgi:hypothetical protein